MSQAALPLEFRAASGREDFIVTAANRDAVAWLDAWPHWPNHTLVIFGPAGCGKSHLAEIHADRAHAHRMRAEQLAIHALSDDVRHVVLENCPVERAHEKELFHLINWVRERGGSLLLTSRSAPSDWSVDLPDLASRLRAATAVEIGAPDEDLLRLVMVKMLVDHRLEAEPSLIDYALARVDRSFGAVRQFVTALDRRSLAERRGVTKPLVRAVLKRHETEKP